MRLRYKGMHPAAQLLRCSCQAADHFFHLQSGMVEVAWSIMTKCVSTLKPMLSNVYTGLLATRSRECLTCAHLECKPGYPDVHRRRAHQTSVSGSGLLGCTLHPDPPAATGKLLIVRPARNQFIKEHQSHDKAMPR